jgi:ABC-2 type transport system permease protein
MLKLMKYEFRKQAFSKLVILSLVGLLELVFFFGVITSKENFIATSMSLLAVFTFGALFYLAFESIITYSNDLKQKCSYMLFLTPNTSYSIVGAKVLSAGIQIILAGLAFFVVFAIDGAVLIAKYDALAEVKELVLNALDEFFKLKIEFSDVASVSAALIAQWISTITLAFFSITLSTTFLANKKFKGIVSFALFIGLNILYSYIVDLTLGDVTNYTTRLTVYFALQTLYMVIFTIVTYVGTAWMLDKKVSV